MTKSYKFFIIITLIILSGLIPDCNSVKAQTVRNKDARKHFNLYTNSESDYSYWISEKPVTNREYIAYLFWIDRVFSNSVYPFFLA